MADLRYSLLCCVLQCLESSQCGANLCCFKFMQSNSCETVHIGGYFCCCLAQAKTYLQRIWRFSDPKMFAPATEL